MSSDPSMILLAAIALVLSMCAHGFGVVITKRMKETNSIHVNYIQGLLIFFTAAVLLPYGLNDLQYHNPSLQ